MRIGKVDGKPCLRVRKNSNGTTQVQPVRKEGVYPNEKLVNDGDQFVVERNKFVKGKL